MRKRFDVQLGLGQTPIEKVVIPLNSRDELPPILAGLQWIFQTKEVSEEIFKILEQKVNRDKDPRTGRPGMDLWEILVLGVVRLGLGCDYDRLEHIANYDGLVRELMGLSNFGAEKKSFHHKTISENVCAIDDEMLEQINEVVVLYGREELKKRGSEKLEVKTDSYVLETNVHYPTDCNLLLDSGRKCTEILSKLYKGQKMGGWRKASYWHGQLKNGCRRCEKAARGGGKNKAQRMEQAAAAYLEKCRAAEEKVSRSVEELSEVNLSVMELCQLEEVKRYHWMMIKHMDLVERRMIQKEVIPHEEKVFSVFEEHTELIKKGKAMPPVEFGHQLLVSTDQHDLVVDYKVMERTSERAEIVGVADRLLLRFGEGNIRSLSTDQGFSSREDRELLGLYIDNVVMPKRGKKAAIDKERENGKDWRKFKRRHSVVESNINSLEHHGLDRCPDKGLRGYKRYVGLGILAYNLHKIGVGLLAKGAGSGKKKKRRAA